MCRWGGMTSKPVVGEGLVFVSGLAKEPIGEGETGGGFPTRGVPEVKEMLEQFGAGEELNFRMVPTLHAIDTGSGVTHWKKEKKGGRLHCSGGYLFTVDTTMQLNLMEQAAVTTTYVTALKPSDGKTLWESRYEGEPVSWAADEKRFYLYATSPVQRFYFTPSAVAAKAKGNVVCAISIGR